MIALVVILILSGLLFWVHRERQRQQAYIDQVNELSLASYSDLATRKIEWVSNSFLELTGYSRDEMLHQSHNLLKHPDVDDSAYEKIYRQIASGEPWKGELKALNKQGEDYWVNVTYSPEFKRGKVVGVWATRVDITDTKHLEEMAIKDELTGVYNRNQFNEIFDAIVDKASRNNSSFAMAMFDLDDFKKINDRFGHVKGDEVLRRVIDATKNYFNRSSDQIFRVGGEEFVILTDANNFEQFAEFLENFRAEVESLNIPNPDSELDVLTVSVGAIYCEKLTMFVESHLLYSNVDHLLYQAKHDGRNKVVLKMPAAYCL